MSEPTNSRQEPTTIHWLTLPRNGNGGAALVTWRDKQWACNQTSISYLLGDKPPRYPVPALPIKLQPMKHGMSLIERHAVGWRFVLPTDDWFIPYHETIDHAYDFGLSYRGY